MIEYPPHTAARESARGGALDGTWFGPRAILLVSVLIAILPLFIRPVTDTDLWLHTSAGRWIIEHHSLPAYDLFTYTVPDHRWIDHEYLSEVLLWLLQAWLGLAGVSVAFGLLTWLGLLLVLLACRPRRQPYVIVGVAVTLAALAGAPIWGARPQMVTFVLASLELLWLRRALEAGAPGDGSRAILWLPAVMALWSNLHGGWPVGLLLLGVALAAETIRWLHPGPGQPGHAAGRSPEHLARVRRLALVGALSVLAVGLNPNGLAIYAYPFHTLTSAAQQNLILEWGSPNFHLVSLRAFELMALLLVAGLALGRPTAFDLLVALAGLTLALESVRHVVIFVAAATPVLVATWSDVWCRLGPPAFARRPPAAVPRWAPAVGAAALLVVAAVAGPGIVRNLAGQPALTAQLVPVGAADWLTGHPRVGTRMFNEYAWGGYLAGRFYPDPNRRVYVLSEGVLMGDAQLLRYRAVTTLAPGWRRILDQDRVDYVVFDRGSALDDVLATQPDWRLVYEDGAAVIYVRGPRS